VKSSLPIYYSGDEAESSERAAPRALKDLLFVLGFAESSDNGEEPEDQYSRGRGDDTKLEEIEMWLESVLTLMGRGETLRTRRCTSMTGKEAFESKIPGYINIDREHVDASRPRKRRNG